MVATTVFPDPTSPSKSRDMGVGFSKSFRIWKAHWRWESVRVKGRESVKVFINSTSILQVGAVFCANFALSRNMPSCSKNKSSKENRALAASAASNDSGKWICQIASLMGKNLCFLSTSVGRISGNLSKKYSSKGFIIYRSHLELTP